MGKKKKITCKMEAKSSAVHELKKNTCRAQ